MAECGKSTIVNLPLIHAGCADYANVCTCPELYSNFDQNRYRFGVRTDKRNALSPALPRPPWHVCTFLPLVWPRRRRALTELAERLTHGILRAAVNCMREYARKVGTTTAHCVNGHHLSESKLPAGQTDVFRGLLVW